MQRRLAELTASADSDVATAARRDPRHGDRVRTRSETAAAIPVLGDALRSGDLSGDHVDAVTKALKAAPETVRGRLCDVVAGMVDEVVASGLAPQDLAQRLGDETKQLEADDGVARLERQRRATRLRTWTDKHDGMFRVSGCFDPFSGLFLAGRLNAAMAAMFAKGYPQGAPDDPGERQDFLRALALIALTAGGNSAAGGTAHTGRPTTKCAATNTSTSTTMGTRNGTTNAVDAGAVPASRQSPPGADAAEGLGWVPFGLEGPPRFGRPEVIVVLDHTNLDVNGRPAIDWGGPINLPVACLEDLKRFASIHHVVVNNGNVVDPDGTLDLWRTTRLANRAQRRALRALYRTCAVPGCQVPYEFTKPHHVHYWRNGGPTNLANLIPLCGRHHRNVHDNGWTIALGPNRELTITLPTGETMATGPPRRATAAA